MPEGARNTGQPQHPESRELRGGGTWPCNGPGLGPGEDRSDRCRGPEVQERGDMEALTHFMGMPPAAVVASHVSFLQEDLTLSSGWAWPESVT